MSGLGERADGALLVLGARRADDAHLVPFAVEDAEMRRLGQLGTDGVAELLFPNFRFERFTFEGQGRLPGFQAFERVGRVQGELHRQRAARDRADQAMSSIICFFYFFKIFKNSARIGAAVEERGDDHRARAVGRERLQERHARLAALGQHEHAAAGLAQAADQRAQLVLVGEAGGHRQPALAVVRRRSGARQADRAGAQSFQHQASH